MKNWKSNLFIILLVVFILICGFMLGRINFNSLDNENNQIVNEDGNVITNNDKIQNVDSDNVVDNKINSSDDYMSLFVGKYSYKSEEIVCGGENSSCNNFIDLELNSDGRYIYSHGACCGGGGGASGSYSISKDKIYLYNEKCKFMAIDNECVEPNCSTLIKLDYKLIDGKVKIYSGNIELLNK